MPVVGEVVRPTLLARLADRWQVPVTAVVAGAGFGKTTTVAQAVRTDAITPSGIDAWIGLEPGLEHADALAAAVVAELGGDLPAGEPLATVVDAIRQHSPLDVCLVIDDVHRLGSATSSARLLAALVRQLPGNAHLVLISRSDEVLPIGRLRAIGSTLEIGEQDLRFDSDDCARLARRLGREPSRSSAPERFGGWPVLQRLAMGRSGAAMSGYLRDEVLFSTTEAQRRAIFVLAALGGADAALIGQICGAHVDLVDIASRIPLIEMTDASQCRAHELWVDALRALLDRSSLPTCPRVR